MFVCATAAEPSTGDIMKRKRPFIIPCAYLVHGGERLSYQLDMKIACSFILNRATQEIEEEEEKRFVVE